MIAALDVMNFYDTKIVFKGEFGGAVMEEEKSEFCYSPFPLFYRER